MSSKLSKRQQLEGGSGSGSSGSSQTEKGAGMGIRGRNPQRIQPMLYVARQAEMIEHSDGPVFAYCASGTRCSVVWALGQAGQVPVDQILAATAQAGYNLENLRPALEQAASQA